MDEMQSQDLRSLKEVTGAGLSDCKQVLNQCGGDKAKALLEILRENKSRMIELAEDGRAPLWVLEALAESKIEEVVFALSKNRSTPKTIKENAASETMTFSNKKNISDHDRQIAELRKEVVQIKKAYNSLLESLESRDKELFEILGKINKNINQRSSTSASYITFSLGEF